MIQENIAALDRLVYNYEIKNYREVPMSDSLYYGPVICTCGPCKGRIGYFDDTDIGDDGCTEYAIVYWGDMLFCSTYSLVPPEYCSNQIPMKDLISRIGILKSQIVGIAKDNRKKAELLLELEYAETLFYEKHILATFSNKGGKRLFISHSSKDKAFANCLYADLVEHGHHPWLDAWDIKAGQSIPGEIQKGLSAADYTLVLLSPHSVESEWVTAEWETMFWEEINSRRTKIIPLLLEDCCIPVFLKAKKYIDFRENYPQSFHDLLMSL